MKRLSASPKNTRCRQKSTIAEVLRGAICNIDFFDVFPDVAVLVYVQERSWWTTSLSTCSPSGRGRSIPMWSQVTWRVSCLTARLRSLRTGTLSSRMWRKLSCQEYVLIYIHRHIWRLRYESRNFSWVSHRWFTGRAPTCMLTTLAWLHGPLCLGRCCLTPSAVLDLLGYVELIHLLKIRIT